MENIEYDTLSSLDILREALSPAGVTALMQSYGGHSLYVNGTKKYEQFAGVLSSDDACKMLDSFGGGTIYIPSPPRGNNSLLLFAFLFMRGYSTAEIAKATQVGQAWIFKALKRFERKYPDMTVYSQCRRLKKSDIPNPESHVRWSHAYRRTRMMDFIQQVAKNPSLKAESVDVFKIAATLEAAFPPEPHIPKKRYKDIAAKGGVLTDA